MIEVVSNLYVGNDQDWELYVKGQPNWAVVHCAKEPYHREALGYDTPGAPKTHPEYLFARRGEEMCLNMVDTKDPAYIPMEVVKAGVNFIYAGLMRKKRVLVHCNRGESRGPTVAMLFLARNLDMDFKKAEKSFLKKYSMYKPGQGCHEFAAKNWSHFRSLG
jgi:predicted protein tyrosine phosphatase